MTISEIRAQYDKLIERLIFAGGLPGRIALLPDFEDLKEKITSRSMDLVARAAQLAESHQRPTGEEARSIINELFEAFALDAYVEEAIVKLGAIKRIIGSSLN